MIKQYDEVVNVFGKKLFLSDLNGNPHNWVGISPETISVIYDQPIDKIRYDISIAYDRLVKTHLNFKRQK